MGRFKKAFYRLLAVQGQEEVTAGCNDHHQSMEEEDGVYSTKKKEEQRQLHVPINVQAALQQSQEDGSNTRIVQSQHATRAGKYFPETGAKISASLCRCVSEVERLFERSFLGGEERQKPN